MKEITYGVVTLALIFTSFFHILPYFKSEKDHLTFIRDNTTKKIFNQNDNNQSSESDPQKKLYKLEIDYFQNNGRRYDGTYVTDIVYFQYFPIYESCNKSYIDYFGYNRYITGTRLKQVVKRPGGIMRVRTAFDGEEIYLVNYTQISELDKEENKNKWSVIKQVNEICN